MTACATMIVSAVSRKPKPWTSEKPTETISRAARIGKRTFSRNTKPTAIPSMATAMAAYTIPNVPVVLQQTLSVRGNYSTDRESHPLARPGLFSIARPERIMRFESYVY